MSKTVLVTGGCGFAGHHLVEHLLVNTDWDIVVLDSLTYAGRVDRLTDIATYDPFRVKVVWHDLRSPIPDSFPEVNYILHLAAESHVERSITDPVPFIHNNVMATTNLVEWARHLPNMEHFVQISTDEVYGAAPEGYAHREWIDPMLPSNPYAASKVAQEAIAISYWRTYGLPLTITNTMNLYGERQDVEKFMPKTMKALLSKTSVVLHGKDTPSKFLFSSRHWLHARNHADALLWVLRETKPLAYNSGDGKIEPRPNRWHVAGEERDVLQMTDAIAKVLNIHGYQYEKVDYHSTRPGHDHRYALDNSKIISAGWVPPYSLEEALQKTVKWTMENQKWVK
jgi:dTDP-glucose 4,6-dehydratase